MVNQRVALLLLERIGYAADVVSDGAEAIEALVRKPYDVILMDLRMPTLDGLQATQAIRARGATFRQPRIIAMTASAMKGDREACLAAGMDDYISKPVERNELAESLRRASLSIAEAAGKAAPPAAARSASELSQQALDDLGRADRPRERPAPGRHVRRRCAPLPGHLAPGRERP